MCKSRFGRSSDRHKPRRRRGICAVEGVHCGAGQEVFRTGRKKRSGGREDQAQHGGEVKREPVFIGEDYFGACRAGVFQQEGFEASEQMLEHLLSHFALAKAC